VFALTINVNVYYERRPVEECRRVDGRKVGKWVRVIANHVNGLVIALP